MKKLAICIPVYNDWDSFIVLLKQIDIVFSSTSIATSVAIFAVDDDSHVEPDWSDVTAKFTAITAIECIHLAANVGHQRAIALGLCEIYARKQFDGVLVVDSDGEDRPEDMHKMFEAFIKNPKVIFVGQRVKRSESYSFQICYALYKILFRLFTGKTITFGNFSLVPNTQLSRLVQRPELWNHYAATLLRARFPLQYLATERGHRYAGQSTMNMISLIIHGLSAISVFIDFFLARILFATALIAITSLCLSVIIFCIKIFTQLAMADWAIAVIAFSSAIFLQSAIFLSVAIFMTLATRSSVSLPLMSFYKQFIKKITIIYAG